MCMYKKKQKKSEIRWCFQVADMSINNSAIFIFVFLQYIKDFELMMRFKLIYAHQSVQRLEDYAYGIFKEN